MSRQPSDRLKELRIKKGYETAQAAAEAFGWPVSTYRSHENGTRDFPFKVAEKYAAAFSTSANYILTGGNGPNGPQSSFGSRSVSGAPLVGMVSAGVFRSDEGLSDEEILVPTVPRGDIPASVQYALRVDGPSVNLRIADGMYAICALFGSFPGGATHGSLVHVVRNRAGLHENTIKELRYTKDGMILMPVSTDPRFQEQIDFEGDESTEVHIHGVVIGKYEPL